MQIEMIGIDVGFGDVKAVYLVDGDVQYLKVPTAVKYAARSIDTDTSEAVYAMNGREYLVGEGARYEAFSTRSFEFLNKYSALLVHHIFQTLNSSVRKTALGLPLGWYAKKEEYAATFKSTVIDGEVIGAEPVIFPQAVGVLMDYRYNLNGEIREDTEHDGVVLDIGYNTVDVLCFEGGNAVRSDAATLEKFGLSKVIMDLIGAVQKNHSMLLSEQEAKEVFISGGLRIYGDKKDMSETIRSITESYFDELMHTLYSRWDKRLQRAEVMLFAGGGAVTLKNYMPTEFAKIMQVPVMPEYSNARGYLKGLIFEGA